MNTSTWAERDAARAEHEEQPPPPPDALCLECRQPVTDMSYVKCDSNHFYHLACVQDDYVHNGCIFQCVPECMAAMPPTSMALLSKAPLEAIVNILPYIDDPLLHGKLMLELAKLTMESLKEAGINTSNQCGTSMGPFDRLMYNMTRLAAQAEAPEGQGGPAANSMA